MPLLARAQRPAHDGVLAREAGLSSEGCLGRPAFTVTIGVPCYIKEDGLVLGGDRHAKARAVNLKFI